MTSPLEGTLVLDLSRVLAGPFCTMLLGDLGSRVIKVEHPQEGDVTRAWGPPYDARSGLSAYYLSVNRNKESLALDLSQPEGAESVRILARRADILVENFAPGSLAKFGLSLDAMRRETPRLITASITGFGREEPEASSPGFDLLAQAGAGLMRRFRARPRKRSGSLLLRKGSPSSPHRSAWKTTYRLSGFLRPSMPTGRGCAGNSDFRADRSPEVISPR